MPVYHFEKISDYNEPVIRTCGFSNIKLTVLLQNRDLKKSLTILLKVY